MNRILGLDLGSKTLGIAISDPLGIIARAVETIRFNEDDYEEALEKLLVVIDNNNVNKIVLGLPKHMNGDIGIRGEISIEFKDMIEDATGIEVVLIDERLTTVAAEKILIQGNVSRKNRKKVIDQMAAVNILQGYLDRK
ncbi:MAG: Holliday junction resolvase RuvX [Erysipelotrichaceae bacterium]|nr:Holliday junction resolvase RuvX [Erysipelotrichaceae bacterium]